MRDPSGYAAEGEAQLRHCKGQRGLNLGHLVLFDGRLEDTGKTVLEPASDPREAVQSVREVFVDVRPRWSKRAKAVTPTA